MRGRRKTRPNHYNLSAESIELVDRAKETLRQAGYGKGVLHNYPTAMRRFMGWVERTKRRLEELTEADCRAYLSDLACNDPSQLFTSARRRLHSALSSGKLVLGRGNVGKCYRVGALACEYDEWMREVRGLSEGSIVDRLQVLWRLTAWCDREGVAFEHLTNAHLDRYLEAQIGGRSRQLIASTASDLRGVLAYLTQRGIIKKDLARHVLSPRIYRHEGIPRCPTPAQIDKTLEWLKTAKSPYEIRNRAIFLIFATYGLRAGEVRNLKINDIDWRNEKLRVFHSKTNSRSTYPLMPEVGEAILAYLKVRPKTTVRELFLKSRAPLGPIKENIGHAVTTAFRRAGANLTCRTGARSLRHALAVRMLRNGASLKSISDMLGHRSSTAVYIYLKLATEDLRGVCMDPPLQVHP